MKKTQTSTRDSRSEDNSREIGLELKIEGEKQSCLRPETVTLNLHKPSPFEDLERPLFYKADALIGLAMMHVSPELLKLKTTPSVKAFCREAWQVCEPHLELYRRAQPKVHEIRRRMPIADKSILHSFETRFVGLVNGAIEGHQIKLSSLHGLIEAIDQFENLSGRPILYNFGIQFSLETVHRLQAVFSFLFNLRALVGLDFNTTNRDSTYDSVKVDSISDYIPKADYVANDGVLYQKISRHLHNVPSHVAQEVKNNFWEYSHNAACLVDSLPKDFLNSVAQKDLSEALYLAQMNWLLGTEAGLLYRIREELYGLHQGYENLFWPEIIKTNAPPNKNEAPTTTPPERELIQLNFKMTESDVFPEPIAA